jgi:nicotinamidase-related amidase
MEFTLKTSKGKAPMVTHRDTAVLVIDVQQGLFRKSTPIYKAEQLLKNINTLVDRAHRIGTPVFYIQHSDQKILPQGSDDWKLHPQLHPLDTDCIIHKTHGNAFEQTSLKEELSSRNIDRLVVTGLVTHGCVRATCIGAKKLGYKVVLVRDGHSNYHKNAAQLIEVWNQELSAGTVELKSTREIDFD